MSNRIIEGAYERIRALEEEQHRLTITVINLQINLRTALSNTRAQASLREEIERIGIRLILITRDIEHYVCFIGYEESFQNQNPTN